MNLWVLSSGILVRDTNWNKTRTFKNLSKF